MPCNASHPGVFTMASAQPMASTSCSNKPAIRRLSATFNEPAVMSARYLGPAFWIGVTPPAPASVAPSAWFDVSSTGDSPRPERSIIRCAPGERVEKLTLSCYPHPYSSLLILRLPLLRDLFQGLQGRNLIIDAASLMGLISYGPSSLKIDADRAFAHPGAALFCSPSDAISPRKHDS
jgi:hypothetical protein